MKELTVAATLDNIETVTDFVNGELGAHDCPMKAQMQISSCIRGNFSSITVCLPAHFMLLA